MHKRHIFILAAALLAVLALASGAQAMSSENYALDWMVLLNGGGGAASSANYSAHLTFGQTAPGTASSSGYSAGLGYWFGMVQESAAEFLRLHLPLILRGGG
jgi:hypothetical protein